jgi:Uma2 family endonuclease
MSDLMASGVSEEGHLLLTFEKYMEEWYTEPPEKRRCEIIDGVRCIMPNPTWPCRVVLMNLVEIVGRFERKTKQGKMVFAPFDVLIRKKPLRIRQPDILFISNALLEESGGPPDIGPLVVGPELMIEIPVPSETEASRRERMEDYRSIGALEVWIVHPIHQAVEVFRLSEVKTESVGLYGRDQIFSSLAFPDLKIVLSEVFASE